MEVEELLKPRYKVIADYPFNKSFKIGEVIALNEIDDRPHLVKEEYALIQNTVVTHTFYKTDFDKYPHLFKKLEWWQERKESDMPEYVKWAHDGKIHKVFQWLRTGTGNNWLCDFVGSKAYCFLSDISIATKEEYQNQKQ
jgi:hypothetical protein